MSSARVFVAIVQIIFDAKKLNLLNEYILIVVKKRSQSKQAIVKMVQECSTYVEQTSMQRSSLSKLCELSPRVKYTWKLSGFASQRSWLISGGPMGIFSALLGSWRPCRSGHMERWINARGTSLFWNQWDFARPNTTWSGLKSSRRRSVRSLDKYLDFDKYIGSVWKESNISTENEFFEQGLCFLINSVPRFWRCWMVASPKRFYSCSGQI